METKSVVKRREAMGDQAVLVLAVVGSRTFTDQARLNKEVDAYLESLGSPDAYIIISGGAKGADTLAAQYAFSNRIIFRQRLADWDKYGKGAGYIRNQEIVDEATHMIAFWDGESRGTHHSITQARKKGLPVRIVHV